MLTGRSTSLKFDDLKSPPKHINNGNSQGCPLSMILYNVYSASLIDVAKGNNEVVIGYVDDTALLAIGKDFATTTRILKDMLERNGGGLEWSSTHNSPFEMSKLAVMHLSLNDTKRASAPELVINHKTSDDNSTSTLIPTASSYKYLGVIVTPTLGWSIQHNKVLAKATTWTTLFRRLVRTSKGLPAELARRLYIAVALPKIIYAADVCRPQPQTHRDPMTSHHSNDRSSEDNGSRHSRGPPKHSPHPPLPSSALQPRSRKAIHNPRQAPASTTCQQSRTLLS